MVGWNGVLDLLALGYGGRRGNVGERGRSIGAMVHLGRRVPRRPNSCREIKYQKIIEILDERTRLCTSHP